MTGGCAAERVLPAPMRPDVEVHQPTPLEKLPLAGAHIEPMYRELLPIDLPNVLQVAMAQNVDIRQARERLSGSI